MYFQSYFNTSVYLIQQYDGSAPLHIYLKKYFSPNKKHGSKDRKFIIHACYCYFRLGRALQNITSEERLKTAFFLCNAEAGEWHILFNENWLNHWSKLLNERIEFIKTVYKDFDMQKIFPWPGELSETIDAPAFARSHLIQPDLFLRIRPGRKNQVIKKLQDNKIAFKAVSNTCLSFASTTKTDKILELNTEAVVQDYSSQRISESLELPIFNFQLSTFNHQPLTVWDCCAASGGKSILAFDVLQNIELTVSDVRSSIMQNLKQRFKQAGIEKYNSFILDLSNSPFTARHSPFDLIICDTPCSGSGTWGRTPEQLCFFAEDKIDGYAMLQKKIISNVIRHLKKGGYFLYITCSVFKKENESISEFIAGQLHLRLIKQELLKGYIIKADTMFAALFHSPLQ